MTSLAQKKENANAEVMDWLDFSANARIHQTILQRPFDLLAEEQLQLLPKPYQGIHPTKAAESVTIERENAAKRGVYIPHRDLQSYDEFIPVMACLFIPVLHIGGAA